MLNAPAMIHTIRQIRQIRISPFFNSRIMAAGQIVSAGANFSRELTGIE
jgi:hypothetical protein